MARKKSNNARISNQIGEGLDNFGKLAGYEGFSKIQRYIEHSETFSRLIFSKPSWEDRLYLNRDIKHALNKLNNSLLDINFSVLKGVEEIDGSTKKILQQQFKINMYSVDLGMYQEQRKLNNRLLNLTYIIIFLTIIMLTLTYLTYIKQ